MAAITANNTAHMLTKHRHSDGYFVDLPVAASTAIHKDSFVGLNPTGYLTSYVPWAQGLTPTGTPLVGIACEQVASHASDGGNKCRVQVDGYFEYCLGSAVQADVGKCVYAIDNATLTKIGLNNELVGRIVDLNRAGYITCELAKPTTRSGIASGYMVKRRLLDVANVVNDEVYLVHETENHNGLYLAKCWAIVAEAIANVDAAAVVTIVHTLGTDTTLGCTLTVVDNDPVGDLVQGSGGVADDGATQANMVMVPADVACIAKVTTVGAEAAGATGQLDIIAKFAVL